MAETYQRFGRPRYQYREKVRGIASWGVHNTHKLCAAAGMKDGESRETRSQRSEMG